MYQEQKFTQLLARNEDWIIAKILVTAKSYNKPECQSLINLAWRKLVKTFSEIILELHKNSEYKEINHISNNYSIILEEYSINQAQDCINRNIEPHTYLSFLKKIRGIYEDLISDANLISGEKVAFYQFIGQCFDCIEIAYIKYWGKLSSSSETHIKNNPGVNLNFVPFPAILVNQFHSIVDFNDGARELFPYLFETDKPIIDNSI